MEARGVKSMSKALKYSAISILVVLILGPAVCFGLTVEELRLMLDRNEKFTIIDVRSLDAYRESHIPGAINIPAEVIARKRLPPIGRVVVCGDGIRKGTALTAVQELNQKDGIQAEILEGGILAWEGLNFPVTQRRGLKRERFHYLTYQKFQEAAVENPQMVLVDIRRLSETGPGAGASSGTGQGLVDLSERYGGLEIITFDRGDLRSGTAEEEIPLAALSKGKGPNHGRVYVLIDSGDGRSEKLARRLQAAGIKQVVILLGGEKVLQREGRPGRKTEVSGQ